MIRWEDTRPKRRAAVAAVVAVGAALPWVACNWTSERPAPPRFEPLGAGTDQPGALRSTPHVASRSTGGDDLLSQRAPLLEIADRLRIRIHQVEGTSPSRAALVFEPALEPMERCRARQPSSLRIRVVTEGHHTAMDVAPGSDVDPETRRCVLEALSMLDVSEGLPPAPTVGERERSFASTVTISW